MKLSFVNKAIAHKHPGLELVKGDKYFYFAGAGTEVCKQTMVMVPRLNDLTLENWIAEADAVAAEVRAFDEDRAAAEPSGWARTITAASVSFAVSELSDIRIALQDRHSKLLTVQSQYLDRTGKADDDVKIEMDRLAALITKVSNV
ncbi:hypothetical protein [Sphingobium sp. MK2]|uniref:hypothetical protein n=1 Tax=Sphingobium sp. MK2 TaxID=3116540 RepID=UPI0032E35D69